MNEKEENENPKALSDINSSKTFHKNLRRNSDQEISILGMNNDGDTSTTDFHRGSH